MDFLPVNSRPNTTPTMSVIAISHGKADVEGRFIGIVIEPLVMVLKVLVAANVILLLVVQLLVVPVEVLTELCDVV